MTANVNGVKVDPPTEASNPTNSTSTPPGIPNTSDLTNAIKKGNIDAVQALIERGADVNGQLPWERTVLQAALQLDKPQIDCVKILLENGANIYDTGNGFPNALVLAVVRRLDNVFDLMMDGGYIQNKAELPANHRFHLHPTILHVAATERASVFYHRQTRTLLPVVASC
ncbi:hypothetical protein CEP54_005250 [Fusarium duplospermum]|uniref:Uncharacterized protein n=1 Tax=Fusarium duplospermum TaxID=1325734 RepID=A0A428QDM2_9HYPO|nr:hypothetical protein CEP54_005250 [Fusarium duplospermum]